MTSAKGRFLIALLLGGAAATQSIAASSAEGPTIESAGPGSNGFFWKPSAATVGVGASVAFRSTSTTVPHGVRWTGGPEEPSCNGVPVEQEKIGWSGECTFAKAGTYTFVCTVHPTEMKGTITVNSGEAPPVIPPPAEGSPQSPLQGPAKQAVKLAKSQQGSSVRGSVDLSQASAGGRLEVLLLAEQGLRRAGGSRNGQVGRLVRTSIAAGRLRFAVRLASSARRALRSRKRLPLTVRVIVKPPGGTALELSRGVVLHV